MREDADDQPRSRGSHIHLEGGVRSQKATKIVKILSMFRSLEGARVLEIGCGSGHIAAYLVDSVSELGSIHAVDVVDERVVTEGYEFQQVAGTHLPFEDGWFDVVISNHVLEHVGSSHDQANHLAEIGRVLGAGGHCYLAVPNRWALLEPHYGLPLLSWLKPGLADAYVRLTRKNDWYDVNPPSRKQLLRLIRDRGLAPHDATVAAIRIMLSIEGSRGLRHVLFAAPGWAIRLATPIIPTMIYVLKRAGAAVSE